MSCPSRPAVHFATDLEENGWPVELVELDADHASIAGASLRSGRWPILRRG